MGCVVPGAGTPIQDATCGTGAGDTIYVHEGAYDGNVDVYKRLTLIGDGADVATVRAADARAHVLEVAVSLFKATTSWVKATSGRDSIISPADAAIALQLAATGVQNPAADVSGGDRIISSGALMILEAAAGTIEL